jgi:hypothetical protein
MTTINDLLASKPRRGLSRKAGYPPVVLDAFTRLIPPESAPQILGVQTYQRAPD